MSASAERVLVLTGMTGKSGLAFARLISENRAVIDGMFPGGIRVAVRASSDTSELDRLLPDAEKRVGNLYDTSFDASLTEGADTVFHVAGIRRAAQMAGACAANSVRRLVLVHTTGIFSGYRSASEEYVKIEDKVRAVCGDAGIMLTMIRPTMIYGTSDDKNISEFVRMVKKLPVVPLINGGRSLVQPVHYTDLAGAYYLTLTHEAGSAGHEYNISGGSVMTVREMLEIIGNALGKKRVLFINVPRGLAFAGAKALYRLTKGKKDLREKVMRLCEDRAFPYDDAARDLGYSPARFEDMIADEIRVCSE